MEQRLRRNASAVEADSARIHLRIDQRGVHAEIGGEKCGGVSSRTAANDGNVQWWGFSHVGKQVSKFQRFQSFNITVSGPLGSALNL
jgi:alpha-tubulin suppressor-like RCC1 family protein